MNHLTTLERVDDHRWVYGSRNRRHGAYAIGYCGEQVHAHDTEQEARECYGQWMRDHVRLDVRLSWTSCQAEGCNAAANKGARVEGDGYRLAALCDKHLTNEHAIPALHIEGPAGDAWQS